MKIFAWSYAMLADMGRQEAAAGVTDERLVEKARGGDRSAFEELVELHLQRIWRVVWGVLRHREDTEDVVQEVFLAAHRALPGYRGEARFSTWLHRIAVNRALNHRARAAEKVRRGSSSLDSLPACVEPAVATAAPGVSPLQALEEAELRQRLATCLGRLPAAWRAVVALRDREALSYDEIARVMETALGTVRSRLARARLALRRCLEGEGA